MITTVRRSIGRPGVAATLVVVTLLAVDGAPAGAVVTGPCDATGAIDTTLYVPRRIRGNEVVTIPKAATVRWDGSIGGDAGDTGRRVPFRGGLDLTVAGFDVVIDRWHGTTGKVEGAGKRAYDAGALPGGVVYHLHGTHRRGGSAACKGELLVKLDGGKGAAVPVALVGSAVTFVLTLLAARRGRVLGALAGLLFGGFVALDLVLFARADLASRGLLVFPVVCLVLGAIAPMKRRRRPRGHAA